MGHKELRDTLAGRMYWDNSCLIHAFDNYDFRLVTGHSRGDRHRKATSSDHLKPDGQTFWCDFRVGRKPGRWTLRDL